MPFFFDMPDDEDEEEDGDEDGDEGYEEDVEAYFRCAFFSLLCAMMMGC